MKRFLQFLQLLGIVLVATGLFHGMFDSDSTQGMWNELWYLLAGAGMFYGSFLILRKRK